jgi:hypothetical protein
MISYREEMKESNCNLREAVFRGLKPKFSYGKNLLNHILFHLTLFWEKMILGLKQPRNPLPHPRFQFSPSNPSTIPRAFTLPGLEGQSKRVDPFISFSVVQKQDVQCSCSAATAVMIFQNSEMHNHFRKRKYLCFFFSS